MPNRELCKGTFDVAMRSAHGTLSDGAKLLPEPTSLVSRKGFSRLRLLGTANVQGWSEHGLRQFDNSTTQHGNKGI